MSSGKYKTVAFDSCSEMARLYFSKAMGKSTLDTEKIRAMNDYPAATERMNMLIRRLKNLRDQGTEIVFTAHEDIQKVYARGGAMASKGQQPAEPVAVKGWPDMPGNRTPDEMCRAADNVFHIRMVNKIPMAIANREVLGAGGDYWETKDRFNARSIGAPPGILPFDYTRIKALVEPTGLWNPAYIWIFYGPFGVGKTRALLTFPRPLYLFDLDRGTKSIPEINGDKDFVIDSYDVEDARECERFIGTVAKLY
jgi:hypothetical protein